MTKLEVVTPDSPLAPYIGTGMPVAEVLTAGPEHLEALVVAHLDKTPELRESFMQQLEGLNRGSGLGTDTTQRATVMARELVADTVATVQHLIPQIAA